MRLLPALSLLALGAVFSVAPSHARAADDDAPLPTDPSLVTGRLENGVRYIVKRHGNPAGHVSIWTHIHSGSMNETEAQRGIAHFLEHMAFNGSENFAPGTVVQFFESLGLSFGRDQNAFTSYDQTTYQLDLPDTTDEMLDRGMLFMSDVAYRLSLLPDEIASERGIIVEEKRSRSGAQQRVRDQTLRMIVPGSRFAERSPIGTDETLQSVQKQDFLDYYTKWYTPGNTTVIVVGDLEPARAVAALAKRFGVAPARPVAESMAAGFVPPTAARAAVITDSELRMATVSIVKTAPYVKSPATAAGYRTDIVKQMGQWLFNRRLATMVGEGTAPFLGGGAGVSTVVGSFTISEARAVGRPDAWGEMLDTVAMELQRARTHGFTDQEVADVRTGFAALVQQAIDAETTRPSRAVLSAINSAITSGDPIMSAHQDKAVIDPILETVSAEEISAAFRAAFENEHPLFLLTMPTGDSVPSDDELLERGLAALAVETEMATESERATALMEELPEPVAVEEWTNHAASGVTSGRMANGVWFHHRYMDKRKEQATIAITMAGGQIEETAANRGITEAAVLAFGRPATSTLTSTQIRDLTTGKSVGVGGGAGSDAVTLSISGDPDDLETGLQLAHILLTDGVLENAALDQWKESQRQAIPGRKQTPGGVAGEAFADALFPAGEVRNRALELEQVEAITHEAAQAWLSRLCSEAPLEISVVGDISLERASELVTKYLGTIPKRAAMSADLFADLRKIERPKGPIRVARTVVTPTPQAIVVAGFFAVDRTNLHDLRRMFLASRILSTRMITTIREEQRLVYSIGANSSPSDAYPGYGLFVAQAPTDPAKAEQLVEALGVTWDEFAATGPTADEMDVAKAQFTNMLATSFDQPNFWIGRLATMTYRSQDLDNVMGMSEAYAAITADEIREVFAKYAVPENRFAVSVVPVAE